MTADIVVRMVGTFFAMALLSMNIRHHFTIKHRESYDVSFNFGGSMIFLWLAYNTGNFPLLSSIYYVCFGSALSFFMFAMTKAKK